MQQQGTRLIVLLSLLAAGFLFGCTTATSSYRDNPDFERRIKRINSIVVLPTRARVYQVDAGGIKEEIPEWSLQATRQLDAAVQKEFQQRSKTRLKMLSEEELSEPEKSALDQTRVLLEAVETSIFLHTYGPPGYRFPEKILDFDYSLGTEVRALGRGDADALLVIQGIDHQWTEGRKALQTLGVIVGVGAAVATGVVAIPVLGGGTMIKAALVDGQTGTLWWYNIALAGAGYDLRDPGSVAGLVRELFKDYPSVSSRPESSAIGTPER
jgi:hypothetical protein